MGSPAERALLGALARFAAQYCTVCGGCGERENPHYPASARFERVPCPSCTLLREALKGLEDESKPYVPKCYAHCWQGGAPNPFHVCKVESPPVG